MKEDDFEPRLGRVGRDRRFASDLRRAANLARGAGQVAGNRLRRFVGSRIGRGSGVARVLASQHRFVGSRARRVVVKARIVKLAGRGAARAAAHLRYLQRDGTTREGERGTLYSAGLDAVEGRDFQERCSGDRHQFRFIVAPEDGADYEDLKPLVRRLMAQAEQDLGTKLDWAAVDHFNTGHPHSHILVRGVDDRGRDLVIAPDYIGRGLRERAVELVNLDLGPRTDREIFEAAEREIAQERFTGIDRRLLAAMDRDGVVVAHHGDPLEQARRAGRLATLARMGLAEARGNGAFALDPDLEPVLRAMGKAGDVIATMNQALREPRIGGHPRDYRIYDPAQGRAIVGEVLARGLSDELADRRYLVIGGTDGGSHYVELGSSTELDRDATIVRVVPVAAEVRAVDRTIAEVAARHDGRYSVDAHLSYDPSATENFAESHVRRLEAMRRAGTGVERAPDGSWSIAPDHLDRALAFERRRAAAQPVRLEVLAMQPVAALARHDGLTWLDEQCASGAAEPTGQGFGASVRSALAIRRQWLVDQEMASEDRGQFSYRANMTALLRQRELQRVGRQLAATLGLEHVAHEGGRIEGTYRRTVQVGTSRYAVIEDGKQFSLVPWRPVLDKQIGRRVSGMDRGGRISWTIGKGRAAPDMD